MKGKGKIKKLKWERTVSPKLIFTKYIQTKLILGTLDSTMILGRILFGSFDCLEAFTNNLFNCSYLFAKIL